MDPARKRKLRFVIALTCALLLASALIYTSFSASSEARSPSQLATSARAGQVYQLTGKVQPGSIQSKGTTHTFRVRDREGRTSIPVTYTSASTGCGSLPGGSVLLSTTPGTHTFKLVYAVIYLPPAGASTKVHFSNRRLYVAPRP